MLHWYQQQSPAAEFIWQLSSSSLSSVYKAEIFNLLVARSHLVHFFAQIELNFATRS